ncbi:MAG: hypothetical protein ACJAV4_000062 [Pontimonas sp.]|jgi:hypothetical protein
MAKRAPSFLPDRFDDVEREKNYVGIYRSTRSVASLFAPIGIALGVIAVLIVGGLWFVQSSAENLAIEDTAPPVIEGSLDPVVEEPPVAEEEPVVEEALPVTDPTQIDTEGLTLTVLNGTAAQGMAARAGTRLSDIGWPEATATNADSTEVEQSVVAYSEDSDEASALGIAQVLGIGGNAVVQTSAYPGARITIVLGADYVDTEST